MTVELKTEEIIIDEGSKYPPDFDQTKTTWKNLVEDKTHSDFLCLCPSCLYWVHKKDGGKFDKEVFFLEWLHFEIKLSLVNQKIIQSLEIGSKPKFHVNMRELFKVRGSIRELSEFIKKNFSEIDHNCQRIKLKLWRLQKSGILGKLEIKISQEWRRKHPESAEKRKEWEKNWGDLRRAQKIADFIYSRLDKSAIQRVICRRFFQKKSVDDLEEMRPWLNTNYGILWDKGKRKDQIVYTGKRKSSRGRFFKVGP